MFDVLRRHQNVTPLLAGDVPIGPNALAARERMIALLLANGFPPALAARTYATLARYILGFAIQLTGTHVTSTTLAFRTSSTIWIRASSRPPSPSRTAFRCPGKTNSRSGSS